MKTPAEAAFIFEKLLQKTAKMMPYIICKNLSLLSLTVLHSTFYTEIFFYFFACHLYWNSFQKFLKVLDDLKKRHGPDFPTTQHVIYVANTSPYDMPVLQSSRF